MLILYVELTNWASPVDNHPQIGELTYGFSELMELAGAFTRQEQPRGQDLFSSHSAFRGRGPSKSWRPSRTQTYYSVIPWREPTTGKMNTTNFLSVKPRGGIQREKGRGSKTDPWESLDIKRAHSWWKLPQLYKKTTIVWFYCVKY